MFAAAPISERRALGPFLASRGLAARGVEVGTHKGAFADALLASWPGTLYCVDPWACPPGFEPQAAMLAGFGEPALAECRARLARYGDRARLVRLASLQAADGFADESLDFVYLDGDHRREMVLADLAAWWPKVRGGGWMCGHDIVQPSDCGYWRQVQQAVLEFFPAEDVLLLTESGGEPWSYMVRK